MNPNVVLKVEDAEYTDLVRQGLVLQGLPPLSQSETVVIAPTLLEDKDTDDGKVTEVKR